MVLKVIEKNSFWMIAIAGFFVLLILVFAGYSLRQMQINSVQTASIDPSCDLHRQACEALFENDGKIVFSVDPKPIKPLTSLQLNVEVINIKADSVLVDFQGIGIDMGFYRPELVKQDGNRYSGTASLSVCTLEKMLWQSTVIIKTNEGAIIAPFRFEVEQS